MANEVRNPIIGVASLHLYLRSRGANITDNHDMERLVDVVRRLITFNSSRIRSPLKVFGVYIAVDKIDEFERIIASIIRAINEGTYVKRAEAAYKSF